MKMSKNTSDSLNTLAIILDGNNNEKLLVFYKKDDIMSIESISELNREYANLFILEDECSTDMIIGGKMIDMTKVER